MLRFTGSRVTHCDGISRRRFLQAGSLGLAGFTLPELLRAEDAAGTGRSRKAIIHIHLDGGPPQMDLIDPKPDAPAEIRGPFKPIRTNVPGIQLTELMPKMATIADKVVFLRSLVGADGKHHAFQCQSGYTEERMRNQGGFPAMGCVINQLMGAPTDPAPAFVDIMQGRPLVRNSARPGFLGPAYKAFRPDISDRFKRELEEGMKKELSQRGGAHTTRLQLPEGVSVGRLDHRLELLKQFDQVRRDIDQSGSMQAMDRFTQQAYSILTSGTFAEAMDLSQEDPRVVARFTPQMKLGGQHFSTSEGPEAVQKLLLARRLVEAGVRVVSVSLSDFDTHENNFPRMQHLGPLMDFALHALITDLDERGMLDDVTVLAWGEFGRTPKVNGKGGRDHWPQVSMGLMAGGGLRTGQVIGATDQIAGEVVSRPVHYQDVLATLYHNLGIDAGATTIMDPSGRPHYLLDKGQPISELI